MLHLTNYKQIKKWMLFLYLIKEYIYNMLFHGEFSFCLRLTCDIVSNYTGDNGKYKNHIRNDYLIFKNCTRKTRVSVIYSCSFYFHVNRSQKTFKTYLEEAWMYWCKTCYWNETMMNKFRIWKLVKVWIRNNCLLWETRT